MIQNSLIRWLFSLAVGVLITFILFLFMNYMISSKGNEIIKGEIYKVIDFVQPTQELSVPEIQKELPPEPVMPKEPPKVPKVTQDNSNQDAPKAIPLDMVQPSLGLGKGLGGNGTPKMMQAMKIAKMDSVLTPMIQMNPVYPSKAKRMGIEGYVKVALDVDASGYITRVKILKSVPAGIFDKSVKKALRRWKFRPKTVAGKPVAQTGVIRLNFNLGSQ